jgi:hypothetical protein
MEKPTGDMKESRRIYAMIEYGPPAIRINWNQIASNYHFNIKEKLKAAGYEASEGSFGPIVRYEKKLRKVI